MKTTTRLIPALLLIAASLPTTSLAAGQQNQWQVNYEDNYNYSQQDKNYTTFNTWFWREDSVGQHQFEYVDKTATSQHCTAQKPCVKLTAPVQPKATAYINAEMYNNSCVKQGAAHPMPQPFDMLADNPLGSSLQNHIRQYCDKPYPYREDKQAAQSPYANDSWNTTTPGRLYANPWAFTSFDNEPAWQAVRDIAFNSPYLADKAMANRMTMDIKAEGEGGGSRGWGYWNTSLDPAMLQLAWFMEYSVQDAKSPHAVKKAVVMQTISFADHGKIGICSTRLPNKDYDIYQWHRYQIEWSTQGVNYFVDGTWVASHTQVIPNTGMAFHHWVDNRNYFGAKYGPANFPLFQAKSNYIDSFRIEQMPESGYRMPSGNPTYAQQTKCWSLTADRDLVELLKALAKEY